LGGLGRARTSTKAKGRIGCDDHEGLYGSIEALSRIKGERILTGSDLLFSMAQLYLLILVESQLALLWVSNWNEL